MTSGTTDPTTSGPTDPTTSGTTDPTTSGTTDPTASGTTDPTASGTTDPTGMDDDVEDCGLFWGNVIDDGKPGGGQGPHAAGGDAEDLEATLPGALGQAMHA